MAGHTNLIAAALLLALSGCDLAGEVLPIPLQEKKVTFRFEFSSDGRSAGEPIEMASTASADLGPELLRDGFTKGEVLSASVVGVDLVRIQPIGVNLSTLREVSLALTASSLSRTTIAQSTSLPNDDDAPLSVSNARATGFVTAPSFSAVLTVVPSTLQQDSDYVLTATVRLRIEVEGV